MGNPTDHLEAGGGMKAFGGLGIKPARARWSFPAQAARPKIHLWAGLPFGSCLKMPHPAGRRVGGSIEIRW
jgi:hypothetical protein